MDEERRKKYREKIQKLRLMDDDFMRKFFEGRKDCTELLIRIILGKDDLSVVDSHTQYAIKNLQGRSVCFDIKATDSEGKEYDIEIEKDKDGASEKRARHNSSMLDANYLQPRDDVKKLPESYVIFITEKDFLGYNEPIYFIDRYIRMKNKPLTEFGDGSHIVYVNGEYKDDTPLGKLMHDFSCTVAADMNYEILRERATFLKETEEGVKQMSAFGEELRREGFEEGRAEGRIEGRAEGKIEGMENGLLLAIKNLIRTSEFSAREAMSRIGIAPADYGKYERMLAVSN